MNHQQPASPASPIELREENRLARVILNHQGRKNAVNSEMRTDLRRAMKDWVANPHIYAMTIEAAEAGVFSAGGDLQEILAAWEEGEGESNVAAIFKNEYETIWALECYTKSVIAIVNGPVMGGGVGLSQFGTHFVAGEDYRWSMPEVKIGFFPDVGVTYKLARMPQAIGIYLALTGRAINRADGHFLGLTEHCIDAAHHETIVEALRDSDPVDPLLDNLHKDPGPSELEQMGPLIERIFSKKTVPAIIEALNALEGEHQPWAKEVVKEMAAASPMSLMVTHEALKRAATMELHEVLQMDYLLAQNFVAGHDFREGLTAMVKEKRPPKWRPHSFEDIDTRLIEACFEDRGAPPLDLPHRELGLDK